MQPHLTRRPPFAFVLLLSAALGASAAPQGQGTASYVVVDNVEGDYIDTLPAPVRPMVLDASELNVYAVNTHASLVQHYYGSTQPYRTFAVPKAPVSLALWDDPDADSGRLVVVCRGTYALAILDLASGDVVGLLELRDPTSGGLLAEPGDLLIDDAADRAFVSCTGSDVVAEIDLRAPAVVRTFAIPGKSPLFLCFDEQGDVLVAPLHSGNNSAARPTALLNAQAQGPTILDFATMGGGQLPDQDLFRLVRSSGAVQAVTKAAGTIQFACGVNPFTKEVWQLNTEANNKDPNKQGEPAIRGDIVRNRLSIATLPGVGAPPNAPSSIVDLDQSNPTVPFDPTRTVGQPYALAFTPQGFGFVAGLLTDNVTLLDSAGQFVAEWDLPAGAIPRGVVYSPAYNVAYVYCWGTNTIEMHWVVSGLPKIFWLDLGPDPTPPQIREGRRIFYDASNSMHNNASCASCHVDGGTDMVVWDLSKPLDDKGPMVTQTLRGIERMVPFHWRGEQLQHLLDFNPAFDELLGGSPLSGPDFGRFEDFVFSLQNPANPHQNVARVVDDGIQPFLLEFMPDASARATVGQSLFLNPQGANCEGCHNVPLGTSNDLVGDGAGFGEQNPRRQFFKIAPFHELYRKEQDVDPTTPRVQLLPIAIQGQTFFFPLLGVGLSHAGLLANLNMFNLLFGFPAQMTADVTAFVHQWDQGLAPAVHRAVLLDQANYASASAMLQGYLVPQADPSPVPGVLHRNCDLAVFGTTTISGAQVPMRWFYDGTAFRAEDSGVPPQPLGNFLWQAQHGQASNVFLGLPVGSAERFAVDYDGDELYNADELALGTDPWHPDKDGDGWPDGHEVKAGDDPHVPNSASSDTTGPVILRATTQFVSAKVARINVQTDEPATLEITYTDGAGTTTVQTTDLLAKTHSVLLNELRPSTTYSGTIVAYDIAVNPSVPSLLPNMPAFNQNLTNPPAPLPITTRASPDLPEIVVIGDLQWGSIQRVGGTLSATPSVQVLRKTGSQAPQAGHIVIARIFVDGALVSGWTPTGGARKVTTFEELDPLTGNVTPFTGLTGPFLVSTTTGGGGYGALGFSLPGLLAQQKVTVNVELVAVENGTAQQLQVGSISLWSMPDTPEPFRKLTTKY